MGNEASKPQSGAEIRVIGAGLSRTGTASLTSALSILYQGPAYHGGTQTFKSESSKSIRTWTSILAEYPYTTTSGRARSHARIREELDGYIAFTDAPASFLVPELLEIYPNVRVICTIREPESWVKSMGELSSSATPWFLTFALLPTNPGRYFVNYITQLRRLWYLSLGEAAPPTTKSYHRQLEHLRSVVPDKQLMLFDVRDGWEPLCEWLNKPVPEVPFPRINEAGAIDNFAKMSVGRGLFRWASSLVCLVAGAGVLLWARMEL
ncbi:Hypothetical protein D9617_1g085090 [Elsinoe fawcettii]|nr:Hypothetical protein D9617_1g085090 [Elsinoe fawcettii]